MYHPMKGQICRNGCWMIVLLPVQRPEAALPLKIEKPGFHFRKSPKHKPGD
jgi:hypothetical protein